jgi:flagellar biosynthesis protein FlhG
MPNTNHGFIEDQAAGLRRIMAGPTPRVITVISAFNSDCHKEQPRLLSNLAASLLLQGSEVLIMHTGPETREATIQYSLNQAPALIDAVMQKSTLAEIMAQCGERKYEDGYNIAKLSHKSRSHPAFDGMTKTALSQTFSQLASHYDVILLDAVLNKHHELPLPILSEHEIVIHLTQEAESIKQAYILIKQMCQKIGQRSFGILVSQANNTEAQIVFNNISEVAQRFMQIELEFIGNVPKDEHISHATSLGRAVVNAFPRAQASLAFKGLAKRLDYKQDLSKMAGQVSFS